jgi:hypothetical protein
LHANLQQPIGEGEEVPYRGVDVDAHMVADFRWLQETLGGMA